MKKIFLALVLSIIILGSGNKALAGNVFIPASKECIAGFDVKDFLSIINEERGKAGLKPLAGNEMLGKAADMKLKDMIKLKYFGHINKYGTSPWVWVSLSGYKFRKAGENLAVGYGNARQTVAAWMNSPSHKSNILNRQYKDVGFAIGILRLENGEWGVAVVQEFGG
ncbi:MAG: CAP domain-containing protein [Candidatus Paceibacterota bacterium]|jgi:uncharacterized protein YkwD